MSLPDLFAASAQNSNHKKVIKWDFDKPADGGVVNEAKTISHRQFLIVDSSSVDFKAISVCWSLLRRAIKSGLQFLQLCCQPSVGELLNEPSQMLLLLLKR